MRVLVTGAAGFIGEHLTQELERAGHRVGRVDRNYGPAYDLCEPRAIEYITNQVRPEAVIHLAAQVGREFGEDDAIHTVTQNAGVTTLVAKACGEAGIRLMYASTSEVYGDVGTEPIPCHENEPLAGRIHNLYGLSKKWGEEACGLYAPGSTIMRLSMPYGPGLPAGRGRAALINFLYNALHRQPITVHRGSERSWCWIGDTVRAVRALLEGNHPGAYNVGRDDNALTMLEVARRACDLVGAPHDLIVEVEPPERQTVVKRLSTEKIRSLGWQPTVELDEGMERTLEWVKTLPAPIAVAA